jgi:hypothetical protein
MQGVIAGRQAVLPRCTLRSSPRCSAARLSTVEARPAARQLKQDRHSRLLALQPQAPQRSCRSRHLQVKLVPIRDSAMVTCRT